MMDPWGFDTQQIEIIQGWQAKPREIEEELLQISKRGEGLEMRNSYAYYLDNETASE